MVVFVHYLDVVKEMNYHSLEEFSCIAKKQMQVKLVNYIERLVKQYIYNIENTLKIETTNLSMVPINTMDE